MTPIARNASSRCIGVAAVAAWFLFTSTGCAPIARIARAATTGVAIASALLIAEPTPPAFSVYGMPDAVLRSGDYPIVLSFPSREAALRTELETVTPRFAVSDVHPRLGAVDFLTTTEGVNLLDGAVRPYDGGAPPPPGVPLPAFDAFATRVGAACGFPADVRWGTARVASVGGRGGGRLILERRAWPQDTARSARYVVTAAEERMGPPSQWSVSCRFEQRLPDFQMERAALLAHPAFAVREEADWTPGIFTTLTGCEHAEMRPCDPVAGLHTFTATGKAERTTKVRAPDPMEVGVAIVGGYRCVGDSVELRLVARADPLPKTSPLPCVAGAAGCLDGVGHIERAWIDTSRGSTFSVHSVVTQVGVFPRVDVMTGEVLGPEWGDPCDKETLKQLAAQQQHH